MKRSRIASQGEAVVSFIRKYFPGAEVQTCYEAGYCGLWLHRHLVSQGVDNRVIHAASVEVEAGNRVKTDKRDSQKLAEQLDAGRLREIYIPSEEQEHRRLITRTRGQLLQARTRARIQIRMKLHQFGLFPVENSGPLTNKKAQQLIEQVSIPELKIVLRSLLSQWEHLSAEIKKLDFKLKKQAENDELELGKP